MIRSVCLKVAVAAAVLMAGASGTWANLVSTPLPDAAYITHDGLDWAWASPVNEQWWGSNELMAPDFHEGWRFATDQEMASRPTLADFTRPNESLITASEYWNTYFTHVDASDLASGYVSSTWGHGVNETLYVRDADAPVVPLPGAALLGLLGLSVAGARLRRHAA